jgi:hypothetical protein
MLLTLTFRVSFICWPPGHLHHCVAALSTMDAKALSHIKTRQLDEVFCRTLIDVIVALGYLILQQAE